MIGLIKSPLYIVVDEAQVLDSGNYFGSMDGKESKCRSALSKMMDEWTR